MVWLVAEAPSVWTGPARRFCSCRVEQAAVRQGGGCSNPVHQQPSRLLGSVGPSRRGSPCSAQVHSAPPPTCWGMLTIRDRPVCAARSPAHGRGQPLPQ